MLLSLSATAVRRAAVLFLVFPAVLLFLQLVLNIHGQPVSFDGAMNLQVAAALVEGQGYARFYDHWVLFPREIQTNAPVVLPAAAVFALLGVSFATGQVVSLLYLVAFVGAVFWLVQSLSGRIAGLAAVVLVLLVPELSRFGAGGYGEVPALFWWLLALIVAQRALPEQDGAAWFWVGVLLAMAVLTKTVMLMPVGVALAVFVPILLVLRDWKALGLGLAGLALPVLAWELFKLVSMGGLAAWSGWWDTQLEAVLNQAGVGDGFEDTPGMGEKLIQHAAVLSADLGVPMWLLPVLGLVPLGLVWRALVAFRTAGPRCPEAATLLVLAACMVAYFGWWLFVTPTEKAWYRRIFNGVLLLYSSLPLLLVWGKGFYSSWFRPAGVLAMAMLVLPLGVLSAGALGQWSSIWGEDDRPRLEGTRSVVDFMRNAPDSARFYGYRWYSKPVFGLYAERRIFDLARHRCFFDDEASKDYFLIDGYLAAAGLRSRALQGLEHRTVLEGSDWGSVVQVWGGCRFEPFSEAELSGAKSHIDFLTASYSKTRGLYRPEGDGWRWSGPRAQVLMRIQGESELLIEGFLPPRAEFDFPRQQGEPGFALKAQVEACDLGAQTVDKRGTFRVRWSLAHCNLPADAPVLLELRANALLRQRGRPLSWIARNIQLTEPQVTNGE